MAISGIETQYQNHTATGSGAKSSKCACTFDSFQKAFADWENRVKETIDQEKASDKSGNIQMSEKQWRNLIKKVDSANDALKNNIKDQAQQEKQAQENDLSQKDAGFHIQTDKTDRN